MGESLDENILHADHTSWVFVIQSVCRPCSFISVTFNILQCFPTAQVNIIACFMEKTNKYCLRRECSVCQEGSKVCKHLYVWHCISLMNRSVKNAIYQTCWQQVWFLIMKVQFKNDESPRSQDSDEPERRMRLWMGRGKEGRGAAGFELGISLVLPVL